MSETGNEPISEGDQGEPESPAPSAGSRESQEPDWKKLYLEQGKPAQEEANRLRRELEAREAARQSPAAETQPGTRPIDWSKVRGFGESGDPNDPATEVARASVAVGEALLIKNQEDREFRALMKIKDEDEREATEKYLEEQRAHGRSIDVKSAHDAVRTAKLEQERDALKEALRRAEANKRDPDEKRVTSPREVPASQMKRRTISNEEFDEENEGLSMHESMKLQAQILSKEVELKKKK